MDYKNKHTYILLAILFTIFVFIMFFGHSQNPLSVNNFTVSATSSTEIPGSCGNYQEGVVKINNATINVDISDTDCKRALGLSDTKTLSDGTGMIFIFPQDGNYGFWMKQMNFSLDMVWVSADFHVVGIVKDVTPASYDAQNPSQSQIFGEQYLAQYVLELPAGYTSKENIQVGNTISFSEESL